MALCYFSFIDSMKQDPLVSRHSRGPQLLTGKWVVTGGRLERSNISCVQNASVRKSNSSVLRLKIDHTHSAMGMLDSFSKSS